MTVKQVAEYFNLSPPTIYEWVRAKKIGHLKLPGGSIRIREDDVQKLEAILWRGPGSTDQNTESAQTEAEPPKSNGPRGGGREPYQLGQRISLQLLHGATDS